MSDPIVLIEKTFDGNHAVFVGGAFRFVGTEPECAEWVAANVTRPAEERRAMGAALLRAVNVT